MNSYNSSKFIDPPRPIESFYDRRRRSTKVNDFKDIESNIKVGKKTKKLIDIIKT